MVEEFEAKLLEKLGVDYERRISEKISEFGGLLTKSAAILLLCRENGVEIERKLPLSEASGSRLPFSFEAKIDRVFPAQEFAGGIARSLRLHVSEGAAQATVVLWNEHALLAERTLRAGCAVLFSGAYFRDGEISLGKSGSFAVRAGTPPAKMSELSHGICSVEGVVREVEPDYHYIDRKTGEKKRLSSFLLCQGEECRRVVIWQPDGKTVPEEDETVLVENVQFRRSELHFNSQSRMVRKGGSSERRGKLERVECGKNGAEMTVDGKKFSMPIEEALLLLGIRQVPEGVEPCTLFLIKGKEMRGKSAAYRAEGKKLVYLAI